VARGAARYEKIAPRGCDSSQRNSSPGDRIDPPPWRLSGELSPPTPSRSSILNPARGVRSGIPELPEETVAIGRSLCSENPTRWQRGARESLRKRRHSLRRRLVLMSSTELSCPIVIAVMATVRSQNRPNIPNTVPVMARSCVEALEAVSLETIPPSRSQGDRQSRGRISDVKWPPPF
jgi:hypothetical protein